MSGHSPQEPWCFPGCSAPGLRYCQDGCNRHKQHPLCKAHLPLKARSMEYPLPSPWEPARLQSGNPQSCPEPLSQQTPLWSISPGSQPGFPASAVKAGSRGCPTALVTLGASPFPLAAPRGMRERKVPGAYSVFSLEEGSLLENTWNLLGLEYGVKVLPPAGSPSINSGKGFVLTTLNCAGFVP